MINLYRYSKILTARQFVLFNLVLGIEHFLVLLNAGAYLPMLPYVTGTMDEPLAYVVWGQSNYFAAMGASFLIARPLMKRFGPKNVTLFAGILFSMTCLAALLSVHQFVLYTAVRMVQGYAAGLSLIPSFFLLLEYYRDNKQHVATSLWGLALFVPFSVGPVFGGWLAYTLGDWRLLFVISFFVSLAMTTILWALLADWEDETSPHVSLRSPMRLSIILLAAATVLQQYFNVGLLSDLSSRFGQFWWLFFAFVFLIWLFWFENSRSKTPLVHFSLFGRSNFGSGMLLLCLAFMAVQGGIVQYIIRMQTVEGYTAWHVGLLFLPVFLFSKPLSVLAQKSIRKGTDPRIFAFISLCMLAASFHWMSTYIRPATWETLLAPQFLLGAGLGLLFAPMTAISLAHVPKNDQLHGLDLLNTARNLAAGLAITFSDIGWDRLTELEANRVISPDTSDAARILQYTGSPHLIHEQLVRQASLLTFNDLYWLLSTALFGLAWAVWLLQPVVVRNPDMVILENLGEEP